MSDLYQKIKGKIEILRGCIFVILNERVQSEIGKVSRYFPISVRAVPVGFFLLYVTKC